MSGQQTTPPTDPIKQVAELLESCQAILRAAETRAAEEATRTAVSTRRMPLTELRRDPVLWAAYARGREDWSAEMDAQIRTASPTVHRPPAAPPAVRETSARSAATTANRAALGGRPTEREPTGSQQHRLNKKVNQLSDI